MKLVTFDLPGGTRHIGAMLAGEQRVVDFTASSTSAAMRDMLALIDGGEAALKEARQLLDKAEVTHALADVKLAAPLPEPRQMRDFLCFEKHFRQARANRHLFGATDSERDPAKVEIPPVWYEEPIYYKCNRFSVVGTGTDIVNPAYCQILDYELEFAAILGKRGTNIRKEDARSHIFGYLIFNDVSARDQQMKEMGGTLGPTKGKDFDTGNAFGPCIVTRDQIDDPYTLGMRVRVNGEERVRTVAGGMQHDIAACICHVSRSETLYPGEILGLGTLGNGCGYESLRFLQAGDVVELEVDKIGVLRNTLGPRP